MVVREVEQHGAGGERFQEVVCEVQRCAIELDSQFLYSKCCQGKEWRKVCIIDLVHALQHQEI